MLHPIITYPIYTRNLVLQILYYRKETKSFIPDKLKTRKAQSVWERVLRYSKRSRIDMQFLKHNFVFLIRVPNTISN